ncbi:MAG: metallophosphoesterase family protein [Methylobacteriaceae bacterium]|nr:metallophosphoesterase family protein [Methylobacteriaceae bacterium]
MLIAVLADIHANREALDACLDDAQANGAERYVFLGDIVGYGADPAYAVDVVADHAARGAVVLLGNHDAAIAEGGYDLNPVARGAIDWTRTQLDAQRRDFLAGLPLQYEEVDRLFVHAEASSPPSWNYVLSSRDAELSLASTGARLTFCGHVHRPQLYGAASGRPVHSYAVDADTGMRLEQSRRWLAVLGSVGQPRNRDPAASYGLFDDEGDVFTYRRVPYDIEAAAEKIIAAGLPPALAHRLFLGL